MMLIRYSEQLPPDEPATSCKRIHVYAFDAVRNILIIFFTAAAKHVRKFLEATARVSLSLLVQLWCR